MPEKPPQADMRLLAQALEKGVALQRAGRHAEAERHYLSESARWPRDPDLQQLLGVALKAQGRFAEAEQRLRNSLHLKRAQPHVWANLGNLLAEVGRPTDAASAYREAIALDARALMAWLGLAAALMGQGERAAAAAAYETARTLDPRNVPAAIGLAQIAAHDANYDRADALLREALAREPANAIALFNQGMNAAQQGDAKSARPLIERALAQRPGRADMLTGLAFALQIGGETDAAVARYREAIAANPMHLAAYENLARLLWQLGRRREYVADLDAAIARAPDVPEFHLSRANLLGLAGQHEEAADAFARANALRPQDPASLDGMARMACERGDVRACVALHDRAVQYAPQHAGFLVSRGHSLLRFREFEQAVAAFEHVLTLAPADQLALGDLALAYRGANDPREHWLADYERLAVALELPPPSGYRDMAVFNSDLDRMFDDIHSTRAAPVDQTLRHGTQTLGSLFGRKLDLVQRLRERIDEAVAAYIRVLPDDPAHPFLRRKAQGFRHKGSWSSRLRAQGHHVAHVHPDGWISSAYYVALPQAVDDAEAKAGWFTLGAPPFDLGWSEPVRRYIRPRVGTLVLFPSYFYHATVPFEGAEARTTIAFDAVPA